MDDFDFKRTVRRGMAFGIAMVLLQITVWGIGVYAVIHFIRKFW